MKPLGASLLMLAFTVPPLGCVATTTTSTTFRAAPPPREWARPGYVEWVREVVQRQEGNPAGGAVAGAIIGGIIAGGRGPNALIGAVTGAAIGAAVSQGSAESRTYEVAVRFDDGAAQIFVYGGYSPFQPGQPVVLTPRGLMAR